MCKIELGFERISSSHLGRTPFAPAWSGQVCVHRLNDGATLRVGKKSVRSISLSLPSRWFKSQLVCVLGLVAGILAWLWPIGLGGMMPVGGDVTSFSWG